MENNKLFVTNLNFNTPLQKLVDLCATIGTVKDSYRPEGKGFAFITMQSAADAQRIIQELNGTMLDGRALKIEVSVPKDSRPPRPIENRPAGGPGSGSGSPRTSSGTRSDSPRPSGTPPAFNPSTNAPRKDDRKKTFKKEDDFNKGPAKPAKAKQEKLRGGANRNRWTDELDEDDDDIELNIPMRDDEDLDLDNV